MELNQLTDQQFNAFKRAAVFSLRDVVGSQLADEFTTVFNKADRATVSATVQEIFTSLFGKIKGQVLIDELMAKVV